MAKSILILRRVGSSIRNLNNAVMGFGACKDAKLGSFFLSNKLTDLLKNGIPSFNILLVVVCQ
jgi:hypothetical protein